ncbi:MAG: hypothetical protein A2Y38_12315 [Spirochaetes bacterium GWB1_59_5]|nr:MAG: hypothetical protein A2Y38_12315 [Spirochaetes bacterium GWB1_59_5]
MKLTCPACGSLSSLDALLGNEGAREAVMAALAIPAPLGKLLVQYLAMFRPAQRQLSFDRVASILGELLPMISAASIERNGRTWSAPQDYWRMALEEMLTKRDKLTLPLKSHGYLLEIIAGYGNKAEARQEAQQEDRKAGRTPQHAPSQALPPSHPLPKGGAQSAGDLRVKSTMPESVKAVLRKGKNDGKQ